MATRTKPATTAATTAATAEATPPLYKILVAGKSCHGGNLTWSLPTQAEDGSWTPGEGSQI